MFKKEAIRENEIIYQLIFPVKPFYILFRWNTFEPHRLMLISHKIYFYLLAILFLKYCCGMALIFLVLIALRTKKLFDWNMETSFVCFSFYFSFVQLEGKSYLYMLGVDHASGICWWSLRRNSAEQKGCYRIYDAISVRYIYRNHHSL